MPNTNAGAVGVSSERHTIRWMMLIYDTVLYLICWAGVFLLHPDMKEVDPLAEIINLFLGYLLFSGFRLIFKSYKRILRFGTLPSFSREILSGLLGGGLYVFIGHVIGVIARSLRISLTLLITFAAIYIVASVFIRICYVYLYRFATKETKASALLRTILSVMAFVDFSSDEPGATLHLTLESGKRSHSPINELQRIVDCFAIRGEVVSITQINKGYINRTYRVETISESGNTHKYTLQRINTSVFPDVDALMANFKLTTSHLQGKLRLEGAGQRSSVQTLRPTKDGCSYLKDSTGCWRMLSYLDGVYSLDIPDRPDTFYHAGLAFGRFMKEMADVDAAEIKEVIPNFHNTASRYRDLEEAILRDPKGRVASVMPEIEFVRAHKDLYGIISEALERGEIPTRICHNDCNLNNILFDNETHLPVAIIDLDTVMPSSPLYDYGDSMRIGTNTAKDDETDLSKVSCDLSLYERYARGYLEACGDVLTDKELELLPLAALVITSEDGIRFLMDHINGDTYYNIYYPGQNLDRARTQLKLLEDMERKLPEIRQILSKIYRELGLTSDPRRS